MFIFVTKSFIYSVVSSNISKLSPSFVNHDSSKVINSYCFKDFNSSKLKFLIDAVYLIFQALRETFFKYGLILHDQIIFSYCLPPSRHGLHQSTLKTDKPGALFDSTTICTSDIFISLWLPPKVFLNDQILHLPSKPLPI